MRNTPFFILQGAKSAVYDPKSRKRKFLEWELKEENYTFLLAGHKVDFIAPPGQKNQFSDPLVGKNRVQHGKNIDFTRVVVALALLGHQTSHSQNKFFFPCCIIILFSY